MKIVILGAGRVGGTLAESLIREEHDITLIDSDAHRLAKIKDRLDISTIVGSGSHPNILIQAGAQDADMLIAVTNQDETNIVGCEVAHALFQTPMKIARIRERSFMHYPELFEPHAMAIDVCISPEQLVMRHIYRLIEYPGALQVLDFAEGKVQMVVVRPEYGGPLVGRTIAMVDAHLPDIRLRVAAIFRNNQTVPVRGDTILEVGDEVYFVATPAHIRRIVEALSRHHRPNARIMIGGGGHVGSLLVNALETKYQVKVIEHNRTHAANLARTATDAVVLLGDVSDRALLLEENIESHDIFVAVTNDDEANIMSCIQAKRLGVRQVLALVNRTEYVNLIEGGPIDIAISPQHITIGSILAQLRQGDVAKVHSLRDGAAEAIELVVHGDEATSKVVGRTLKELSLPSGTVIGAVIRGEKTIIAHHELKIKSEDHIILFITDKKQVSEVEKLFQVTIGYF